MYPREESNHVARRAWRVPNKPLASPVGGAPTLSSSSNGSGFEILNLEIGVQIPVGTPTHEHPVSIV